MICFDTNPSDSTSEVSVGEQQSRFEGQMDYFRARRQPSLVAFSREQIGVC
jgi:hypothetical protein